MPTRHDQLLADAEKLEEQGYEAFKTGNTERSRELNRESLKLAREADDAHAIVRALAGLMRLGLRAHDLDEVERLAQECDEVAETAGVPALHQMPLHMRAEAARMAGELDRARTLYDASIRLNGELGNQRMVTIELANTAWLEIGAGRLDDAARLIRSSLASGEQDVYGIAFCLLGLARVELERGNERGVAILGAAEATLEQAGLVWDPAEEAEHVATLGLARALSGASSDELLAAGAADPQSFLTFS